MTSSRRRNLIVACDRGQDLESSCGKQLENCVRSIETANDMTTAKPHRAKSSEPLRSVGPLLRTVAVLGVWSGVSVSPAAAQEAPRFSIAGEAAALARRGAGEQPLLRADRPPQARDRGRGEL